MSNVIKLVKLSGPKTQPIDKWKEVIDEHADKLMGRLYDQIRLTDEDVIEEGIPEEFADCMVIGVLASILVTLTHTRDVIPPDALLKLVEFEIEERQAE